MGGNSYWTTVHILRNLKVDSDMVFYLFANNRDWIYNKIKEIHLQKDKGIDISSQEFTDLDNFQEVDYVPRMDSQKKDEVFLKVFEKVFNK